MFFGRFYGDYMFPLDLQSISTSGYGISKFGRKDELKYFPQKV
jgi:hypothetical protein